MADVITFDAAGYGAMVARLRELQRAEDRRDLTPEERAERGDLEAAADAEFERYVATRQ